MAHRFSSGILTALLCFLGFTSIAQIADFQDGFIITYKNDTIRGKLRNTIKKPHTELEVQFASGADSILTPAEIAFFVAGEQKFQSVPLPQPGKKQEAMVFAEILVDGYASLYKTKLKVDLITSAEEAFLCRKYNEEKYYPAGKVSGLSHFFSDYPVLSKELKSHPNQYTNDENTKKQLFTLYNTWKKHQLDSLAADKNLFGKTEKHLIELSVKDNELSIASRLVLDQLKERLVTESKSILVIEFLLVNEDPNTLNKGNFKTVLQYLNDYQSRIEKSVTLLQNSQKSLNVKHNGVALLYYFR